MIANKSSSEKKIFDVGKGKFRPYSDFDNSQSYELLPIRLDRLNSSKFVVTNEVGEFIVLDEETTNALVSGQLTKTHKCYVELLSKHFITDETYTSAIDLLALKVRTKRSNVKELTALHMFVVTLRCNQSCPYCHTYPSQLEATFQCIEGQAVHQMG